jgi:hypothetical protein
VLNKILRKEKPRVYLGTLAVAPREDIKRHLDQWGLFKTEDLDTKLRQSLKEIFSLPSAIEVSDPKSNDLVLDIMITKFQSGDAWDITLGEFGFPLMWRPKVTVSSRLYYLMSEKTKANFSITEKMKLNQYIIRLLTWRAILRFQPIFDTKDIEYLLYKACHRLLLKIQKEI